MSWPDRLPAERKRLVLIYAPTANDANVTVGLLAKAGLSGMAVHDTRELRVAMLRGCGVVLLAEEVLNPDAVAEIFSLLAQQPKWSDLPVVLISSGSRSSAERTRKFVQLGVGTNVVVLERPFRPATLISALEVALRSRARQYLVRDLLLELSEAKELADKANKAKDEFLAALSHELRTPLNPVLLVSSESAANPDLPEPVRNDFSMIARSVELEARLIDDLLDLTRITHGKLQLVLRPVDIHDALREALATTESEFVSKRISLTSELQAATTTISADPVRLQQVLWNVLKNAAKFTPDGGEVSVATSNVGTSVVIEVRDSGVGMTEEELIRVFEPFAQGEHARPGSGRQFGGLGLGLAISRELTRLHSGDIRAASNGRGRGATLRIELPVRGAAPAGATASQTPGARGEPGSSPRRRALLVEDHVSSRISLAHILKRRGFEVATAGSLTEARGVLREDNFDLLISDLGLPDGSGHELMAELKDKPGLRGIAISGYGMESDVAESRKNGFSAHLTKPVSIQALEEAVRSLA